MLCIFKKTYRKKKKRRKEREKLMFGFIGQLIGPVSNLAGTWMQGKVVKAKAETEVKVARAKAEAKVFETEATSSMLMEQNLTNQMAGAWKD